MDLSYPSPSKFNFDNYLSTPHPQCMPDEYKEQDGFFSPEVASVRAYRKYYVNDKKDIAKWEKSRPMPDWYAEWMIIQNKKITDEKVHLDAYDG